MTKRQSPGTSKVLTDSVVALFVRPDGPYPRLVADWYDEERDATRYPGPFPVVVHPPCQRWGRFWYAAGDERPGNDGGLMRSALGSLRRWGGVLEHPEASHAWGHFGIPKPSWGGGWIEAIPGAGREALPTSPMRLWTTCVAQRNYGHKARKLTWLLYSGQEPPPELDWSEPAPPEAYLCPPGRRGPGQPGDTSVKRLTPSENELTPEPFARLLISLAEGSREDDHA